MNIAHVLQVIWPLIVIQLALQIYALGDLILVHKQTTRNLTPLVWIIIIVLGEIVGAALYFLFGRSEE